MQYPIKVNKNLLIRVTRPELVEGIRGYFLFDLSEICETCPPLADLCLKILRAFVVSVPATP